MAIKPIDATSGIDYVRAASASAGSSRRNSQRPPARSPEAAPPTTAQQSQVQQQQLQPAQSLASGQQRSGQEGERASVPVSPNMRIHVDQDTGKTVVALVNPETDEIVRQVPNDEALAVAKAIGKYQGMFVDLKV